MPLFDITSGSGRSGCSAACSVSASLATINTWRGAGRLQLVPADENEEHKIRTLRDRMSAEVFRYRAADHDTFGFHISLAYQIRDLTVVERREYQSLLTQRLPSIVAAAPIIELGVPEFCTFENMYRFEVQTLLRTRENVCILATSGSTEGLCRSIAGWVFRRRFARLGDTWFGRCRSLNPRLQSKVDSTNRLLFSESLNGLECSGSVQVGPEGHCCLACLLPVRSQSYLIDNKVP